MPRFTIVILAGLLPVFAVNIAFLININTGLDACFPYWEGCYSVSRAVRSGPGLMIYKILAWPSAVLIIFSWSLASKWLLSQSTGDLKRAKFIFWMGTLGAVFFVVYSTWLGSEGEIYRWLRRYGVVFYFGLTALAQLVFAAGLWNIRKTKPPSFPIPAANAYLSMIFLSWLLGLGSTFKRKLIEDPLFQDRVENLLEWNFALVLSLTFVALGFVIRVKNSGQGLKTN